LTPRFPPRRGSRYLLLYGRETLAERYDTQLKDEVGVDPAGLSTAEKMAKLREWREGRYEKLLDAVYKRRGWTNDGVPTMETLHRLGIDFPWVVEVVKPHLASCAWKAESRRSTRESSSSSRARRFIVRSGTIRAILLSMERQLTIEYGEEILLGLGLSPQQFSEEARFLLAAKLYELGRLTSGQAARLCGKDRVAFLFSLERAGVPMSNLRPEDADAEIDFARNG